MKPKKKSDGVFCSLCKGKVVKYKIDLTDEVLLDIKGELFIICDDCSYNIALQRISR